MADPRVAMISPGSVRLKINALEMLRILGDAAITVIPLARYHFSSILDSHYHQNKKPYRSYQSSSTATSPHGASLETLTSSAALSNGYRGSVLANQT
jgi:hypothetical protein